MREIYDKQEIIQNCLKMLSDIVDKFNRERILSVNDMRKYLQKELENVIKEIHTFEEHLDKEGEDLIKELTDK